MFDAAIKALTQMFSPPFRRVLLKSIGLALVLIVLIGIGLNRLFSWMTAAGATWAEATAGGHALWQILAWVLSIAATLYSPAFAALAEPARQSLSVHRYRCGVPDAGGDGLRRLVLRR